MKTIKVLIHRWGPAILLMAAIFMFSSIPSSKLPDFDWADFLLKKSAHAVGYGLLALSFLRGLGIRPNAVWFAWILTCLYALTDEYHQTFVPGRNGSVLDVVIDGLGAGAALYISGVVERKKPGKKGT